MANEIRPSNCHFEKSFFSKINILVFYMYKPRVKNRTVKRTYQTE